MTLNDLIEFGADTQTGLKRCLNNEDFYLRMVKKMPGDANFQKLYDAMKAGDQGVAFSAAHALKGALGNLALTPIFTPVAELTELLRAHSQQDCSALLETIRQGQEALSRICEG